MTTAGVPLWSTTAATNSGADPAVNFAEGMAPSAVNDSARALMASVAKWRDDLYGITSGLSTSGTSTAYTVTTNSNYASASVMSGARFIIIPHTTSGAAPTLAVDGLTARALNQTTGVAIATGALISGTPYEVRYLHASTEFIVLGAAISKFTNLTTTGTITQSTTGQEILPVGTTAQRPSNAAGGFRFNSDTGLPEFNTGSGWFSLISTLAGAQTPYGAVINGTVTESHSGNAVTFNLKTLAGSDPSSTDPVLLAFRNATAATGNYVYRTVTSALSLTISSGSKMGFSDGVAGRLWLVLFDDAGTIRIGAINCLSGTNIYPLGQAPIASSTAEGGAGAADSAQVFYTGTAVTSQPYLILATATYESGVSTAGNWNASPTTLQLFGPGIPLPGAVLQTQGNVTGAVATGTTVVPDDDTIPQLTEGDQFMSQAVTPSSGANVLLIESAGHFASSAASNLTMSVFQDSTANALASIRHSFSATTADQAGPIRYPMQAKVSVSTTFKVRAGLDSASTLTFNGAASSRKLGGALASYLNVSEIMA